MLSGVPLMIQAAVFDGEFLDPFSPFDNGGGAAEVGVSRRDVAEAFVIALVVIVLDEGPDLVFEVTGQVVVFQQHTVLQRLMPAFDLSLGLRMERSATNMVHALGTEPVGQIGGDVGRPIVAEQTRPVGDVRTGTARRPQGQVQRVRHIVGPHGRTQLPGDDVAREVVQDRRQVEPALADHLEVGEVGLPELVRGRGLVPELICRLDDDEGRAGDQVMDLENPIDRGFRDEVALSVREPDSQLAGTQFRFLQGQFDDLLTDCIGDSVPHPARACRAVFEPDFTEGLIQIVPAVERGLRDAELVQRPPDR